MRKSPMVSGPATLSPALETFSLLCRLFLGVLFVLASYDKVLDPVDFAWTVRKYELLPCYLETFSAVVLPWMELVCGVLLIAGLFTRGAAGLLSVLLVIFTAGIAINLARGKSMACGCFDILETFFKTVLPQDFVQSDGFEEWFRVSWKTVIRDLLFLVPAVYLVVRPGAILSLDRVLGKE